MEKKRKTRQNKQKINRNKITDGRSRRESKPETIKPTPEKTRKNTFPRIYHPTQPCANMHSFKNIRNMITYIRGSTTVRRRRALRNQNNSLPTSKGDRETRPSEILFRKSTSQVECQVQDKNRYTVVQLRAGSKYNSIHGHV